MSTATSAERVERRGPAADAGPLPERVDGRTPVDRYVGYFHALDAWTEYWDVYHPESRGRYYFGDNDRGGSEPGLLSLLLPRREAPPVFEAWKRHALALERDGQRAQSFARCAADPEVAAAAVELDDLVGRLFTEHFGDAGDGAVQLDVLEAMHRFAIDDLPPATERQARISPDDHRYRTAGRHTIDADMMWFVWAMQLEIAELAHRNEGSTAGGTRRSLLMAALTSACPAQFAWQGHRRTRPEYTRDDATVELLRTRALFRAASFDAAAAEVHALYRIREWGHA